MNEERFSAEEVSRRAKELYEAEIRERVGDHAGEYIAVDAATGDYETDPRALMAARALRRRRPDAALHLMRIGSEGEATAAYRLGGRAMVSNRF